MTAEASPPNRRTSSPLSHIRICDFTGQLAGAGATKFLAAFGAQVIRIEDPVRQGRWDILRGASAFRDERRGIDLGGAFNNHNVEKLGITLNLRSARGRELLEQLVRISDVVTENFAAGVMILAYRPFDVGDEVEAAGTSGTVTSMNLVSTQLLKDGKTSIVPNSKIWGGIIAKLAPKTASP